jgi:hypothetical protein
MRRLLLLTALALLALAPPPRHGDAAQHAPERCPKVAVSCTGDLVISGAPVTFSVTVEGAPAGAKLTYNWTVSAGTISDGQGTSSLVVDTTGVPHSTTLTATVDVTGLPAACPGSASCSTPVSWIHDPHDKIDEYGNISFEDEKARLDNFAISLMESADMVGYLVAYGGRRARRGEARRRAERAKRYVTQVRGVPASRVVTIDGGHREDLTVELRLRPKDVPPPPPAPTVDPKEVRFIKARPRRGARRR